MVWAYVTYFLFGLIYTCINSPYGILQNVMTSDPDSRISLGSFRMIGCQLGTLAVNMLTLPAVHWLGGGTARADELVGFPAYMAIVGVIGAGLWFVTYLGCRVRRFTENQRRPDRGTVAVAHGKSAMDGLHCRLRPLLRDHRQLSVIRHLLRTG